MVPLEILIGIISVSGVIISAILTNGTNKNKTSSDQTIETMRIQKDLIDSLFEKNKILSERMDTLEEEMRVEREEFNKELVQTRKSYEQLKKVVEEAIQLLKSNKVRDAIELLED